MLWSPVPRNRECTDCKPCHAMMPHGADALVPRLFGEGRPGGVILLGGAMGTDLALDVYAVLPLVVPK